MASWDKVTTDQAHTPDAEKRYRPGWIPRLLDINPYKPFQKTSYSPPDGYSKDYEDANSFEELFGQQYHSSAGNEDNYERYHYSQKDDDCSKDIRREKLYLQFYQQIEKEYDKDRPSDCVIVSFSKDQAGPFLYVGIHSGPLPPFMDKPHMLESYGFLLRHAPMHHFVHWGLPSV